jgi:methionine-R-sulfoxide reductase
VIGNLETCGCGATFPCTAATGHCWCFDVPAKVAVPAADFGARCLCPRCLAKQPAYDSAAYNSAMKVKLFNKSGQLVGPVEVTKVEKTDAEWKSQLGPDVYPIARAKGTEPSFCGNLLDNKLDGVYACACCKLPLFASDAKFESGTGWPSFFKPVADENVVEHSDRSYGMVRTEILCARCDCHLGHVFDDGPRPTGRRHCVNSASLVFVNRKDVATLADPAAV